MNHADQMYEVCYLKNKIKMKYLHLWSLLVYSFIVVFNPSRIGPIYTGELDLLITVPAYVLPAYVLAPVSL